MFRDMRLRGLIRNLLLLLRSYTHGGCMKKDLKRGKDWRELDPIVDKMTDAEGEWFDNFLKGYNKGDVNALRKLTDNETLIESIRRDAVRRSNQSHRNVTTFSRKARYEFDDYNLQQGHNPESAIVEALDFGLSWLGKRARCA